MGKKCFISCLLCLYLGIENGYLAITDSSGHCTSFPYRMELYTQQDQTLLRNGIPIENQSELSKVLEDYFS